MNKILTHAYVYSLLIMHCKSTNVQGITCLSFLNIVEDNNTIDNYNNIATITPMTAPIITPVLSSPQPLVSKENIICYMDTTKHLSICMLITNQ